MRIILPFLLIGLAAVVFFYFTSPILADIDELNLEIESLNIALANATELHERQVELINEYNAVDPGDRAALEQFLPNNMDNVRLIIDINDIAKRYGLTVKNPNIVTEEGTEDTQTPARATPGGSSSALMSFSVTSSYEVLKLFLDDLARSLRLVDLETLSFSATENNLYDYQLSLRTYWLK